MGSLGLSKLLDPACSHQGGTWKVPFSGRFKEKERQLPVWIWTSEYGFSLAQGSAGHGSHGTMGKPTSEPQLPLPPPITPASQLIVMF